MVGERISVTDQTRFSGLTIDGSVGEGGGQLIRNAISYASILRQPVRLVHIRARRAKPGLQAQHVAGLQLAAAVSGGSLAGDQIHSQQVHFRPTKLLLPPSSSSWTASSSCAKVRTIRGGVHTAGSICLMLQAALPCALFSPTPCNLYLKGGTNAIMAPQYDYWEALLLPILRDHCGLGPHQVTSTITRRGFYPKGGGKVQVHVQPMGSTPLQPLRLAHRGTVQTIYIRAFRTAGLPSSDPEIMVEAAREYLKERVHGVAFQTEIVQETQATGECSGILIVAKTSTGCRLGGSSLGPFNKSPSEIGTEAAQEVFQTLQDGGCVDDWLQDQLILFAALADGVSEIVTGSLTQHTQTAIAIAEQMAGAKFEVTKLDEPLQSAVSRANQPDQRPIDGSTSSQSETTAYGADGRIAGRHLIRCYGIGFQNSGSGGASINPTLLASPSILYQSYLKGFNGPHGKRSSHDVRGADSNMNDQGRPHP
jgi:RNA 3'-terminal phosphate cyclase (ATP)